MNAGSDDDDEPPSLRNGFPLIWWLAIAFSAVCVLAGLTVAWLMPHWR